MKSFSVASTDSVLVLLASHCSPKSAAKRESLQSAMTAARALIIEQYGDDHLPPSPRQYKKKVKNAQEAHEAIRPAGDSFASPKAVAAQGQADEARLYELVWKRTVASQMADARGESVAVTSQRAGQVGKRGGRRAQERPEPAQAAVHPPHA